MDTRKSIAYHYDSYVEKKIIDTDRYGWIDVVYDAYCSVLVSIPEGKTVKFKVKGILPDGVQEMLLSCDDHVTELLQLYEKYDKVIHLHVFGVEVDEFPRTDYRVNGFEKALMTRPSARQIKRLANRTIRPKKVPVIRNRSASIGQNKLPVIRNRSASIGRASSSSPVTVKTSSVATITVEGSLRDSGITKSHTWVDSGNQGSTSNSSASADDTRYRHAPNLTPIIDLSNEEEPVSHPESPGREWLDDDEGSIHSSENNGSSFEDDFGLGDTEGETGYTERGVGDTEGETGGTDGETGGLNEREDVVMTEGIGDEENELEDEDSLHYISDEPREEGEYVVREYDIDQPEPVRLEVGQVFKDVDAFRRHLKDYVIQDGTEIIRLKNEKHRVTVICAQDGCPWRVHASTTKDKVSFMVKSFWSQHRCSREGKNREATSTWIARKLANRLKTDPDMKSESMSDAIKAKFGIEPHDMQLYRARVKAREELEGSYLKSYAQLPMYLEQLMQVNPGTICKLHYDDRQDLRTNPRFKRVFICIEACRAGFLKGCRPFVGIDGCHLKGKYGGVLLAAISLDGNNGLFPLAIAVVESENKDSWSFFLRALYEALFVGLDGNPLTFMSDKQKV